jgi:cell division protein YceG involved in septum cleavage
MKKSKKILLLAAVATVLVGIVLAGFVAQYYLDNRRPNFQKEYVLYVYPDMTAEQVLDSILVGAQVERPRSVEHVFKKMNVAENMKPGRYVIET